MIIDYDYFDEDLFIGNVYHSGYHRLELHKGWVDELYVETEMDIPYDTTKPTGWNYGTIVDAKFNGSMEGGSVEGGGIPINSILLQKRRRDSLEWEDVMEVPYEVGGRTYYELVDKYITNQEIYQYCLVPITSIARGERVPSKEVTASFEGVFISDVNSNYQLLYNLEHDQIENNISNAIFTPQNSEFPVVVTGNLDYAAFGVTAMFISAETLDRDDNQIDIRMERLGKDDLMKFIKNGKPKVYRDSHGVLKMVMVVGHPVETPNNSKSGLANLSVNFVEVGKVDRETLQANGLLETYRRVD